MIQIYWLTSYTYSQIDIVKCSGHNRQQKQGIWLIEILEPQNASPCQVIIFKAHFPNTQHHYYENWYLYNVIEVKA